MATCEGVAIHMGDASSAPYTGDDLSPDAWVTVARCLDAKTVVVLSAVSKTTQCAARSLSVWRQLLATDWNLLPRQPAGGAKEEPPSTVPMPTPELAHLPGTVEEWQRRRPHLAMPLPDLPRMPRLQRTLYLDRLARRNASQPPSVLNPLAATSSLSARSPDLAARVDILLATDPLTLYKLLVAGRRRRLKEVSNASAYSEAAMSARRIAWCSRAALDVVQYGLLLGCWPVCIPLWLAFVWQKLEPEGYMANASWYTVFAPLFVAIAIPFIALALHGAVRGVATLVTSLKKLRAVDLRNPCFGVADGDMLAWPGAIVAAWRARYLKSVFWRLVTFLPSAAFVACAVLAPLIPCLKLQGAMDISWGAALAPLLTFLIAIPCAPGCGCFQVCLVPEDVHERTNLSSLRNGPTLVASAFLSVVTTPLFIVIAILAAKADGTSIALKHAFIPFWLVEAAAALTAGTLVLHGTVCIGCVRPSRRGRACFRAFLSALAFGVWIAPFVVSQAAAVAYDEEGGPFPLRTFFLPLIIVTSFMAVVGFVLAIVVSTSSHRVFVVPTDMDPSHWNRALCRREACRGCCSLSSVVGASGQRPADFGPSTLVGTVVHPPPRSLPYSSLAPEQQPLAHVFELIGLQELLDATREGQRGKR